MPPKKGGVLNMAVTSRSEFTVLSPGWWLFLLIVVSIPTSAAEAAATNPHLQSALSLFRDIEYEKALQALDQAKQWPSNTLEDRISIALLEGVLSYETGQPERGASAFQWALEHDLKAKLPFLVSPKVTARLEELREQLRREQSASLVPQPSATRPEPPGPPDEPKPERRMNLKLPVAIGGGVVAVSGLLAWGKGKSLESKVRRADPLITTRAQLEDTLQQGRT